MVKVLFWLCILLILLFLVSFLRGRGPLSPSRLNLKRGSKGDEGPGFQSLSQSQLGTREKNLNPMFMYNGHNFDACEVLGVTPGQDLTAIKSAFNQAMKKCAPESRPFIETALRVLLEERKRLGIE